MTMLSIPKPALNAPTFGEVTPLYPMGYGYCSCGCGGVVTSLSYGPNSGHGLPRGWRLRYLRNHHIGILTPHGTVHHSYNLGLYLNKCLNRWMIACRGRAAVAYFRAVAEAYILKRPLLDTEIVHHIDGDTTNDDPSNLLVMTRAEHLRIHTHERHIKKLQAQGKLRDES